MRYMATIVGSVLLFAAPLYAGPLNQDYVAADARWMFHFDVEAFTQSSIGQCVIEHREELDMHGFDELHQAIGVDVFRDVLGITLYGGAQDEDVAVDVGVHNDELRFGADAHAADSAVAVILMTDAADQLIAKLKEDESYAEVHKDGIMLHSFIIEGSDQRHNLFIENGPKPNQRLLVAGENLDRVVHAVQIVQGKAKNVRGADSPLGVVKPRVGTFLYGAAIDVGSIGGDDDNSPASQILSKSQKMTAEVGESGDDVVAVLNVTADSEEDAMNISQIIQGGVALGRMVLSQHEAEAKQLLEVLNALTFDSEGSVLVASFKYPAKDCCQLLLEMAEHHHDHDADHDQGHDADDDEAHEMHSIHHGD